MVKEIDIRNILQNYHMQILNGINIDKITHEVFDLIIDDITDNL